MDLALLKAQVREVNFTLHGVPAVVTPVGDGPVDTRVIWLAAVSEVRPSGADFARSETRRILAIRRDDVPAVPRGSTISVTEHLQEEPDLWKVDSTEATFSDHHRVVVVPEA